ncbi:MAG: hypothetical protein DHS20C05_00620 [Hyphococcus sp.]|nr:MAG: hypothetical protein DHS20C05_00620 [Marinicaulis sp.]
MNSARFVPAFVAGALTTIVLAIVFYTYRVLDEQVAIGALYTPAQEFQTYVKNLLGLTPTYGIALILGLLIAFRAAAFLKRILVPLAPIAYPLAGAVAVFAVIWLIENTAARGGAGAMGGARSLFGVVLQMAAGFIGGTVFAILRPRS